VGSPPLRYHKDDFGFVHFDGLIDDSGGGSTFLQLPVDFRSDMAALLFETLSSDTIGRLQVNQDGGAYMHTGSGWFSLSGKSFGSAAMASSWVLASYVNGWSSYSASYPPARYFKDSFGIVHLEGLVRAGSSTIFVLPAEYRPDYQLMLTTETNPNVGGRIEILTSGQVQMETGNNGWISLSGKSFGSAGMASSWKYASYQNGWSTYNQYPPARYFVDSFGMVHIEGAVTGGGSAIIFMLPEECRPDYQTLFATWTNPGQGGRVTVETNGEVRMDVGSNVWFSLSGIMFSAGGRP
jgi:hypothetical protein